jgi:hypothetical protein
MSKVSMADVLELTIPERIKLVEDIWDSIAAVPEALRSPRPNVWNWTRASKTFESIPNADLPGKK